MPRGWGTPGTATWIRDALTLLGESWPKRVHNEVKRWAQQGGYVPPSYKSIRKLFYCLRRLGLIELVRQEPVEGKPWLFPRNIYRVTPGMEFAPGWRDPETALYHPKKFAQRTAFRARWSSPEEYMEWVRLNRTG